MISLSKATDIFLNVVIPLFLGYIFYLLGNEIVVPGMIPNYLPDGLWAYALQSCILIIWNRKINIIWNIAIMLFVVMFELLQYLHFIKGTGDFFDIITYFIFFGIALTANKFFISNIYIKLTNYDRD
jgi:hypothetical protein